MIDKCHNLSEPGTSLAEEEKLGDQEIKAKKKEIK